MYSTDTHPLTPRAYPLSSHHMFPCSPSTPPPLIPPPLQHAGSPYARVPLPPVSEDHFPPSPSIHRILRFSLQPNVNFDLLLHPSTITTLPDHRPLSLHTLAEPATNPPLQCMTIVSPLLPWSITVSPPLANNIVTVSNVLVTLHRILTLAIAPAEYGRLLSEDAVLRINAACECRVSQITDWQTCEAERAKGVKRIDFLMGRHRFLGLSRMGRDPDTFVLNVF